MQPPTGAKENGLAAVLHLRQGDEPVKSSKFVVWLDTKDPLLRIGTEVRILATSTAYGGLQTSCVGQQASHGPVGCE